jgi:hypothetical protein
MIQEQRKGLARVKEMKKLCHDVPDSWSIEHPSAERSSHSMESILFDISQEKIMLVSKPFVVTANFLYDPVRVHTKWAFGIVITQASTKKWMRREMAFDIKAKG